MIFLFYNYFKKTKMEVLEMLKKMLLVCFVLALAAPAFATHNGEWDGDCCVTGGEDTYAGYKTKHVMVTFDGKDFAVEGTKVSGVKEAKEMVLSKIDGVVHLEDGLYMDKVFSKMQSQKVETAQLTMHYAVHPDP